MKGRFKSKRACGGEDLIWGPLPSKGFQKKPGLFQKGRGQGAFGVQQADIAPTLFPRQKGGKKTPHL